MTIWNARRGITPSVIACSDATFPKGTALAVAAKFPAEFKGVPLGELPNKVRLRGYCGSSPTKKITERPQTFRYAEMYNDF